MQSIHDVHAPVIEINTLKPSEATTASSTDPGEFQRMLDKSIEQDHAAKKSDHDEHKASNHEKNDVSRPEEKTTSRPEDDTQSAGNRTKDKSGQSNSDSAAVDKKARSEQNSENHDGKKIEHGDMEIEAGTKAKKRDKDLIINDFDTVIDGLDNLIRKMNKQSTGPSRIREELDKIRESLKDTVNTKLEQKLKDILALLKLIKSELNNPEKISLKDGPDSALQSLLQKIEFLKDKLSRQKETGHDTAHQKSDVKVTPALIDKVMESLKHESGDGEKGNDRSGSDSSWNLNSFKTLTNTREETTAAKTAQQAPRFREQLDSLMDRARVVVRDNKNATFTLKLHPRELGSISIKLGLEQGVLHGKFLVDTPEAKILLMQNLETIREELAQSGVMVGDFNVDVSSQQGQFENQSRENQPSSLLTLNVKEIQSEYQNHSELWHNGSINMVI